MKKLVTLKDKFAEYGLTLGELRTRRSDQIEFPDPASLSAREYFYDEEQLDYWFYKVYALKRRKPRVIGPRQPKLVKEVHREAFDSALALAYITGQFRSANVRE